MHRDLITAKLIFHRHWINDVKLVNGIYPYKLLPCLPQVRYRFDYAEEKLLHLDFPHSSIS